ncbi:hypothetical protein [Cryptosporangium sp. NPDC051539]|uniref:hypothetical protein n=1 Tax=Cryptosporangium sp. NPDC051539 TaxID=3363962 RepID=UPI0037B0C5B4
MSGPVRQDDTDAKRPTVDDAIVVGNAVLAGLSATYLATESLVITMITAAASVGTAIAFACACRNRAEACTEPSAIDT